MGLLHRVWSIVARLDRFAKDGGELTLEDFKRYAVWEFATDTEGQPERDETWVRPLARRVIPRDESSLTVAAEVELACGQKLHACAGVSTDDGDTDISIVHVVVGDTWFFIPHPDGQKELAAALGKPMSEIFPIRWKLAVPVQGEKRPRSGIWSPKQK